MSLVRPVLCSHTPEGEPCLHVAVMRIQQEPEGEWWPSCLPCYKDIKKKAGEDGRSFRVDSLMVREW